MAHQASAKIQRSISSRNQAGIGNAHLLTLKESEIAPTEILHIVGGNSDSRLNNGRDSEIVPTFWIGNNKVLLSFVAQLK